MNPPKEPRLTWEQKEALIFFVCDLVAVTLLPLCRRRLGYRVVSPLRFLPVGLLLFTLGNPLIPGALFWIELPRDPVLPPPPEAFQSLATLSRAVSPGEPRLHTGTGLGYLGLFALVSMFLAARQRRARAKEFKQGIAWHSYSRGISILSFLPFSPAALHRAIDPLVAIVIGFAIADTFSPALGYWLVITGFATGIAEAQLQRLWLDRTLDSVDGLLYSEALAEEVARFEQHPSSTRMQRGDIELIHTKLSPDVEALIARRKRPSKQRSASAAPNTAKPLQLWKRLRRLWEIGYGGISYGVNCLVRFRRKLNPKPTKPLTPSQRFWRFFWGWRLWEWWERRHGR